MIFFTVFEWSKRKIDRLAVLSRQDDSDVD
jgi:hypothetical protein